MIKSSFLFKKLFAVYNKSLPGPEVMEHFSSWRGIKIVNQIIWGLFRNIRLLLKPGPGLWTRTP